MIIISSEVLQKNLFSLYVKVGQNKNEFATRCLHEIEQRWISEVFSEISERYDEVRTNACFDTNVQKRCIWQEW